MDITWQLRPEELNDDVFKIIRQQFTGKKVAITVVEIPDETEYLLSNTANKDHLLKAVKDLRNGQGVHTMSIEAMEAMIR